MRVTGAQNLVGLVAVALAAAGMALALQDWFVDDAGIVFAYARNIADGHGAVAYRGGPTVEGVSDPGWTLWLAGSHAAGLSIPMVARVSGLGCAVLAGWLVLATASRHGATAPERTASTALLALSAPLWLWSASGLENGAWALAVTAAVCMRNTPAAMIALAALVWLRPEAPVLALGILMGRRALGHSWRPLIAALVVSLIALYGGRWLVFGTVWPQTAHAKLAASLASRALRGVTYIGLSSLWLGWVALLPGTLHTDRDPRLHPLVGAALWPLAASCMALLFMGGDWMRYARFLAPLAPLVVMATVPALWRHRRWPVMLAAAIGVGVWVDSVRRPPLPMSLITELAYLVREVHHDACPSERPRVAVADVGGVLWSTPRTQTSDLAQLTSLAPRSAWIDVLTADEVDIVVTHGPWVRRTGLDFTTLTTHGYHVLCQRPAGIGPQEAQAPAALYVHQRCTEPLSSPVATAVQDWCARQR